MCYVYNSVRGGGGGVGIIYEQGCVYVNTGGGV